jgi:outer membrane protein assembly factor BamB
MKMKIIGTQKSSNRLHIISLLMLFAGFAATAQTKYEWPSFHGSDQTNRSPETGLLKIWPEQGPELVQTISGIGEGYSSVVVAGGMIFTAGSVNSQPFVYAFDMSGKLVWKKPVGQAWSTTMSWASSYTGTRSTPTYDKGVVFFLGEMGLLTALDAKTGKEIWQTDLVKEFDAPPTDYGYSESVLIDGNRLYVRPAGKKGHQVCLDRNTGKLIWANTQIPGKEGYTSPVVSDIGGIRQLTGGSSVCYYGLDALTGRLLWKVDAVNGQSLNINNVIVNGNYIFISTGYGLGCMLYKLNVKGTEVIPEKIWSNPVMDNNHGGVVYYDGYVYGSGSRTRGWQCIDFMTGVQKWRSTTDEGTITFADGMLYALDQRGTIKLLRATPEKYEAAGTFRLPSGGKGNYWAHPVVCNKRLYIRHDDKIFVYNIGT